LRFISALCRPNWRFRLLWWNGSHGTYRRERRRFGFGAIRIKWSGHEFFFLGGEWWMGS
jgi:hypothetical protein